MLPIKIIKVDNKLYFVSFVKVNRHMLPSFYNAYVILKGKKIKSDEHLALANCSFHEKNVFGVDTIHYYNETMDLKEKYKDAERQIKQVIKAYNKY